MNTNRARVLCSRFTWGAAAVLTVATIANLTGFEAFFLPLAAVTSVLMARASYWAGWANAHAADSKIVAAALTVDAVWRDGRGSFSEPMSRLAAAVNERYPA